MQAGVSTVFLLLLVYTFGNTWARLFPKATWVEGTRFARLSPIFRVINPGPFSLKEVRLFRVEVREVANSEVA